MNSISLTIVIKNGTISNSERFFLMYMLYLTVNELFNIAKCSSASMCIVLNIPLFMRTLKPQTGTQREARKWMLKSTRK